MVDSPRTPDYPPLRNTWQFPPPEVSRRWQWVAVLAGVLALVGGSALAVVLVAVGSDDFPGVIDDERLTATIQEQCQIMTSTVAALPLSGSADRQAATVREQNRAVVAMVRAVRRAHPDRIRDDRPAEQWLRDWERLVDARETFARDLRRDANATLVVPRGPDGEDITRRMDDVWLGAAACEVPDELATPYTDSFSGA